MQSTIGNLVQKYSKNAGIQRNGAEIINVPNEHIVIWVC